MKECTICLDELIYDITKLKCGHIFHFNCIKKWSNLHTRCPECRAFMGYYGGELCPAFDDLYKIENLSNITYEKNEK